MRPSSPSPAFSSHKNYLHPAPALLAAYLGSICGITLNYLVGRYIGFPLLHKYGYYLRLTDERINQAHRWFEKYGKVALFVGYFFPGLRHLTAFSAGASQLEYRHFAPYAYAGGFCWVATFIALGYFVGEEWSKIVPQIQCISLAGGGADDLPGPGGLPDTAYPEPGPAKLKLLPALWTLAAIDSCRAGNYFSD